MQMKAFFLWLILLFLVSCAPVGPTETPPPPMQPYAGGELGLAFDYPVGWYVHEAGKSLQITPNAQPTWSSFFDLDQPHGGPGL